MQNHINFMQANQQKMTTDRFRFRVEVEVTFAI